MKTPLSANEKARQAGKRGARSKHAATKAQQKAAEAMGEVFGLALPATRKNRSAAPGDVPPYCYRLPGMSAEEGAVAAVKALRLPLLIDALAVLWKLQREASEPLKDGFPTHPPLSQKTQQRLTAQAARLSANNPKGNSPMRLGNSPVQVAALELAVEEV